MLLGQHLPRQNPPDKTPRTKPFWDKTPRTNPPEKKRTKPLPPDKPPPPSLLDKTPGQNVDTLSTVC